VVHAGLSVSFYSNQSYLSEDTTISVQCEIKGYWERGFGLMRRLSFAPIIKKRKQNMKRLKILSTALLISSFSFGQLMKIQSGISISNLDWKIGTYDWKYDNEKLIGNSFSVGLDYLDKKYYNLSSNISLLKKGGKVTATAENVSDRILQVNIDYLSVNTTFELKYPFQNKITPFISYGPRLDMLLSEIYLTNYNNYNYGLLLGGGLKYDINRIQVGFRTDYYLNFNEINKPITHVFGVINDKTLTCNLTIGYRLK
jgi:hypothetical protein